MSTIMFRDPGSDALQDLSFWPQGATLGTGTRSSVVDPDDATRRALKMVSAALNDRAYICTADGVCADAGAGISFRVRMSSVAPSTRTLISFIEAAGDGSLITGLAIDTNGQFTLVGRNTGTGFGRNGTATPAANTWVQIDMALVITSGTSFTVKLWVNNILDATLTNADGTLSVTGASDFCLGLSGGPSSNYDITGVSVLTCWYKDVVVDNRTDLTNPGNRSVVAQRAFANGATNGFATQIGSGGSGYGSGHAPQVNEQTSALTNGWSQVGSGSAVTEEYNIEGLAAGVVDLTGQTILDVAGGLYASSNSSETAQIIVNGTQTAITLTATPTLFVQQSATPTVYPAGTGTDIGIVTATTLTTVQLYEAFVLVVYAPPGPDPGMAAFLPPAKRIGDRNIMY